MLPTLRCRTAPRCPQKSCERASTRHELSNERAQGSLDAFHEVLVERKRVSIWKFEPSPNQARVTDLTEIGDVDWGGGVNMGTRAQLELWCHDTLDARWQRMNRTHGSVNLSSAEAEYHGGHNDHPPGATPYLPVKQQTQDQTQKIKSRALLFLFQKMKKSKPRAHALWKVRVSIHLVAPKESDT